MKGDRGPKKSYVYTGSGCKAHNEQETKCAKCIFNSNCEFKEANMKERVCPVCGKKLHLDNNYQYTCTQCKVSYELDYTDNKLVEVIEGQKEGYQGC